MRTLTRNLMPAVAVGLLLLPALTASASDSNESWQAMKVQAKQEKIDTMANQSLHEVLARSPKAKALYDEAYGWAAFSDLKVALGLSGAGGKGVAVNKETGQRTYMDMGSAGAGFQLGVKKYEVVFLFENRETFENFINNGWSAGAGASAIGGTAGGGVQASFVNGIAAYELTKGGLMASADISGTKYWKSDELNGTEH